MNSSKPFAVRNIFSTQDGFSRISVDNETFNAVRGVVPTIPYTTSRTQDGRGVRIFDIDGTKVYSIYDKENRKTGFYMKQTDAQARLRTLAQERSTEPALPFSAF